jgi:hypothetical protein
MHVLTINFNFKLKNCRSNIYILDLQFFNLKYIYIRSSLHESCIHWNSSEWILEDWDISLHPNVLLFGCLSQKRQPKDELDVQKTLLHRNLQDILTCTSTCRFHCQHLVQCWCCTIVTILLKEIKDYTQSPSARRLYNQQMTLKHSKSHQLALQDSAEEYENFSKESKSCQ